MVESKTGVKFQNQIKGIENRNLTTQVFENANPTRPLGTVDYGQRLVIVDLEAIEQSDFTLEYVIDHELLHILEFEQLNGYKPVYNHVAHAAFYEEEKPRLLGLPKTVLEDANVQEAIFGEQRALDLSMNPTSLGGLITEIESRLLYSAPRNYQEQNLFGFAAIALNMLKLLYFSIIFEGSQHGEVFEFERQVATLQGVNAYGTQILNFQQEKSLAQQIKSRK